MEKIAQCISLEEVPEALSAMLKSAATGKFVVKI
jgi:NADPH-dependent curcumin reductase CurA